MKEALFAAMHATGALAVARRLQRRSLVVLTYHGVLPTPDDKDHFLYGNFVAASAFTWQMAWVRRHYTPVSLSRVVRAIKTGEPLPERPLAVTFDDGFANNCRYAWPILQEYGVPVTVFLATDYIGVPGAQLWTERVKRAVFLSAAHALPAVVPELGQLPLGNDQARADSARRLLGRMKRMRSEERNRHLLELERVCGRPALLSEDRDRYDFLSWDEVRTMAAEGVEFGSHTRSHPIVSTLDDEGLVTEVEQSAREIEAQLQVRCETFAFPNGQPGDFGHRDVRALQAAGYAAAFKLYGGLNPTLTEPLTLDRVNVTRGMSPAMFDGLLTGGLHLAKQIKGVLRH